MPISSQLARQVNDTLQEAIGALDLALLTEDPAGKNQRIAQSKKAMRKAADLVAANIVRDTQ
ncbi:MAG TPA: hypothetical protein VGS78_08130 [Candidatus Sulfotelmatobacter sp.]|nr:hypothetical protein [Candidatus Sulfotelmatobacter sp.]